MFIEMTKSFGGKNAGEKYDVEDAVATELIENNLATKCETNPVDAAIEKFQKSIENRDEQLVEKLAKSVNSVSVKMPAVAKNHDDESFGDFIQAISHKSITNDPDMVQKAANKLTDKYNSQVVVVDDEGHKSHCIPEKYVSKIFGRTKTSLGQGATGYGAELVPQLWQKELYSVDPYEPPCFPNRCRTYPMESNVLNLPTLDQTMTPAAGTTAFAGGVVVGWVTEGNAPSAETDPKFLNVQLVAHKLLAYTKISQELSDNALVSMEAIITEQFRRAILGRINYEVFNGSGSGTTLITGIINHLASVTVNRKTAGTTDWTDLAKMYAKLAPSARKGAAFYINPLALANFSPINAPTHLTWTIDILTGRPVMNFLGCPVVDNEFQPVLGQVGDVILADMSNYFVGLNKNIAIEASPHVAFTSDQIVYRVAMRLDGKPGLTKAITLADGTSQVSPFVQLGAVAS